VLKDRLANRRWGVLLDPVSRTAAALQNGALHGCVAGATRPTADVLRLAEQEPRRVALLCRQHSGCLVGRETLQWLPEHQLRQVVGALMPSLFSPPH
jgi:hypothetical protein